MFSRKIIEGQNEGKEGKTCHPHEPGPLNQKAFNSGVSGFHLVLDSTFSVPSSHPHPHPTSCEMMYMVRTVIQFQSPRLMKGSSWVNVRLWLLIFIVSPLSRKDTKAWTARNIGFLNFEVTKLHDLVWPWLYSRWNHRHEILEWTKISHQQLCWNLYLPFSVWPQSSPFTSKLSYLTCEIE